VGVLAQTVIELATADRRRHQQVKVRVTGRFMRSDRQEFDCATIDMSPVEIAFQSDAGVEVGERIVAYLVHLGRLEGTVVRTFPGGFAIRMKLPATKRAKLDDQLSWLANRVVLGVPEDRRHDRIEPRKSRTTVTLANGRAFLARLIDLSQSGAAIAVDVRPRIGERITVGATPAQVVRVFDGGIAVQFAHAMTPEAFGADVVL
jgi:PilZ domain